MSMLRAKLLGVLLGLFALTVCGAANAVLMLEVVRTGDSTALIGGTGTVDVGSTSQVILVSATSLGDSGLDSFGGDFTIGGTSPGSVFTIVGSENFAINFFGDPLDLGDSVAGTLSALLDVETWDPIGTVGVITNEDGATLGTYRIVDAFSSVPAPASALLVGLGLSLMGWARRYSKRQAATA